MIRPLALLLVTSVSARAQDLPRLPEAQDRSPAAGVVHLELTAAPLPPDHPGAAHGFLYGYNGQTPGPTLRARRGDTLVVTLRNQLDAPTSLHWHGVHVPHAMDGVMPPVAPGETFEYSFPLDQAGTYWYHPHFDTERQVDGGLFGALVIEDPAEPAPPDHVLIFDRPLEHDPLGGHPAHGRARRHETWWINGAPSPLSWRPPAGSRWRLRILNASNTGYLALPALPGLRQIANDQGLLAAPDAQGPWILAPGDRVDLEWTVGQAPLDWAALPYSLNGGPAWGDPWPLLEVRPTGDAPALAPLAWPFSGAAPHPDGPADHPLVFTGSDRTGVWYINGERFPQVTPLRVPLGAARILELRNLSPTHHPFHLHGHALEVLSVDGVPPPHRRIEDTLDVGIRQVIRLRLVADNPGPWMHHCHLLPHAEEGMMGLLIVE